MPVYPFYSYATIILVAVIFIHYLFLHMKRGFMFIKCCRNTFFHLELMNTQTEKQVTLIFKPSLISESLETLKNHLYTAVFLNLDNGLSFRSAVCCTPGHM